MYYKYIKESAYKKEGEATRLVDLLQDTDFKEPNVRRAIRANRNATQPQSEAYGYIWTDYEVNKREKPNIDQILTMTLETVRESDHWQVFFDILSDDCKKFAVTPDFLIIKYIFSACTPSEAIAKMRGILITQPVDTLTIQTLCNREIFQSQTTEQFFNKVFEVAKKLKLLGYI